MITKKMMSHSGDRRFHPAPFGLRKVPVRGAKRTAEPEPRAESPPAERSADPGVNPFGRDRPGHTGDDPRDVKVEDLAASRKIRSVAAMEAEIERLQSVVANQSVRLREATVRAISSDDEIERAKKRIRKEALKDLEQSRRGMLRSFLEVLDDLDRALAAGSESDPDSAVVQGVALVRKRFLDKLARYDVRHEPALGRPFDPVRHEAMSMVTTSEAKQDGTIIAVLREGYAIGDDVLRPAGVAVSRWNGDN